MSDNMLAKVLESQDTVFFPNLFGGGIPVNEVMFKIPGTDFGIYWYGFLIAMGLLLAVLFAESQYKKFGLNPDKMFSVVLFGAIGGIIGARAYYVIFSLDRYIIDGQFSWSEAIDIRDGGLAIYGGFIGALLVASIVSKIQKQRLSAVFDVVAMGFFIGQGIGRWGNFVNQEAYGSVTDLPWGMTSLSIVAEMSNLHPELSPNDIMVHPCFLYESILCLVGFLILFMYKKHRKFDGELFLIYLAIYGTGRAVIEGLREDSLYFAGTPFRVSQLLAVGLATFAIITYIIVRIVIEKRGYIFFFETEESINSIALYNSTNKKRKKKQIPKNLTTAIDTAFDEEINVEKITDNSSEIPQDLSEAIENAFVEQKNEFAEPISELNTNEVFSEVPKEEIEEVATEEILEVEDRSNDIVIPFIPKNEEVTQVENNFDIIEREDVKMSQIINGKEISLKVKERIKEEVAKLTEKNISVGLAVVIVGDNAASRVYVNGKKKACEECGIKSYEYALPQETSEKELLELVEKLNNDDNVDGILVQLPLPKQIDERSVINTILPEKDVDAFHPANVGKIMIGDYNFLPCTPAGVMELLASADVEIAGKECVVVGRSNIVGKPMSMLLLQQNGTVTICHSKTKDLKETCKNADILIAAVGVPNLITKDMVKDGAVVIDVGMNRLDDGKLCGDVDYENVKEVASYITPVPGGVGPMTIAMLMQNTLTSAKVKNNIK